MKYEITIPVPKLLELARELDEEKMDLVSLMINDGFIDDDGDEQPPWLSATGSKFNEAGGLDFDDIDEVKSLDCIDSDGFSFTSKL